MIDSGFPLRLYNVEPFSLALLATAPRRLASRKAPFAYPRSQNLHPPHLVASVGSLVDFFFRQRFFFFPNLAVLYLSICEGYAPSAPAGKLSEAPVVSLLLSLPTHDLPRSLALACTPRNDPPRCLYSDL